MGLAWNEIFPVGVSSSEGLGLAESGDVCTFTFPAAAPDIVSLDSTDDGTVTVTDTDDNMETEVTKTDSVADKSQEEVKEKDGEEEEKEREEKIDPCKAVVDLVSYL